MARNWTEIEIQSMEKRLTLLRLIENPADWVLKEIFRLAELLQQIRYYKS